MPESGSLVFRIRIGDKVFKSGDGHLQKNIRITLSELEKGNSVRFSLCDPGLEIGSHFQQISFSEGGILVPSELIQSPQLEPQSTGTSPAIAGDVGMGGGSGQLSNYPSGSQGEVVSAIVKECLKQGINQPHQIAFMLAVAEGESNFNHKAYNDEGGRFGRYGGRGLGQITHDYNYKELGAELKQPLLQQPELAFRPDISTYILVRGVKKGWCSQGGLLKWVSSPSSDLKTAYRKIQGGVWGDRYQRFYNNWLPKVPALIAAVGGQTAAIMPPTPAAAPAEPVAIPAVAVPVVESSFKGTEIIVEAGYDKSSLLSWHFIHTNTNVRKTLEGETVEFEGQSVRWLLTQVPENRAIENSSFKELAETFLGALNVDLNFEGKGAAIAHRDITNLTPYQVLSQEAKKQGFTIRDNAKSEIIIQPYARVEITNFIVDHWTFISADFGDQAKAFTTDPGLGMGDPVASIDSSSGETVVNKENIAVGTIKPGTQGATTGSAVPAVSSIPAPAVKGITTSHATTATAIAEGSKDEKIEQLPSTQKVTPDGTKVTSGSRKISKERGKITTTTTRVTSITGANNTVISQETRETEVIETIKGTTTKTSITRDGQATKTEKHSTEVNPDVLKTEGTTSDRSVQLDPIGLPRQPSGAIDLADGKAEPVALVDEKQAIEGFKSTIVLLMTERTLRLVPGEVIGLSRKLFPEPYSREWRIREVSPDFEAENITLTIYTPQAPPPEAAIASVEAMSATPDPGSPIQFATPSGGWMIPSQGRTGDGVGRRSSGRNHNGYDIAASRGSAVVAPADGVIFAFTTGYGGGFGYSVVIRHAGEIFTRHAHCIPGSCPFQKGQQVKVGVKIAGINNTGHSFGDHLHTEIRRGGEYGTVMLYSQVGVKFPQPHRAGFRY